MKSRDPELNSNWGTICTLVHLTSEDGKRHKEITADTEGIFRIIQSIPSPKAEPFKYSFSPNAEPKPVGIFCRYKNLYYLCSARTRQAS